MRKRKSLSPFDLWMCMSHLPSLNARTCVSSIDLLCSKGVSRSWDVTWRWRNSPLVYKMPSAKYRNLRENTADPWTHDNLTRNKVARIQHFDISFLQSWERTSTHTFLRGVKSGISFMKGDIEIINKIRDAFVLWPSNSMYGTLSYKNICTRMK